MEINEIEQRIDDAVNEIPLESILKESRDKLEEKLERYEKNRKGLNRSSQRHRLQAYKLGNAKSTKKQWIAFGKSCIRLGVLIMLCVFVYQFFLKSLFG